MKKLFRYLKKYKKNLILGPLFKLFEAIIEITLPMIMAYLIDHYTDFSAHIFTYYLIFLLVLVIVGFSFAVIAQYIAAKTSQGYSKDLRKSLFYHIQSLPAYKLKTLGTSAIVNRIINDVTNLETGVAMFIRLVIRIPFIFIGAITMIFVINTNLALIVLLSSILLFLLIFIIAKIASNLYGKANAYLDKITLKIKENLTNLKLIRSFVTQDKEYHKFEKLNMANNRFNKFANICSNVLNPISIFVLNITILFILNRSDSLFYSEMITKGEMIAIINYITEMLLAVVVLSNLVTIYTKCFSSSSRIIEILNLKPDIQNGTISTLKDTPIAIKMDHVSFSYTTNPFLENISLEIQKGEIVGFIGLTASGKSTIFNLLNRTFDVNSGNISIFGKNIKDYEHTFLKDSIYLINEHPYFLTDTIFENIAFGRTTHKEDIENALMLAEANDFVLQHTDYLNYTLTNNASNLSGGQRQRLHISRAFIGSPSIILFDNITSSLDLVTENKVITNIFHYLKEHHITGLIASQKITSIIHCDKIVVLDNGKIVDMGTHTELLKRCKLYNEIYDLQGENDENK